MGKVDFFCCSITQFAPTDPTTGTICPQCRLFSISQVSSRVYFSQFAQRLSCANCDQVFLTPRRARCVHVVSLVVGCSPVARIFPSLPLNSFTVSNYFYLHRTMSLLDPVTNINAMVYQDFYGSYLELGND